MTHIVTESCIKCKFTDCVKLCPVDCFYEGPNMLVINPDECIDCGVCIPECPVDAIVMDDDKNTKDIEFWIKLNAEKSLAWPNIRKQKEPLPDADEWREVTDKKKYIEE